MDERKKLDELTEEGNCKCAQFCQEQQDSNQCNSLQLSELRTWYLGNPCWTLDFFEGYKWLEKGIEEGGFRPAEILHEPLARHIQYSAGCS